MAEDWQSLGMAVRLRRNMLGLSREDVGDRVKVSARTIGTLETGRPINKANARLVAYALGWTYQSADDLLAGKKNPTMRDDDTDRPVSNHAGQLADGTEIDLTKMGELTPEDRHAVVEFVDYLINKRRAEA